MQIDFRQKSVQIGSGVVAVAILLGLLMVFRGGGHVVSTASTTASAVTARLVLGEGTKKQTPPATDFLAVPIPCDVAERDMLMFGDAAYSVMMLPEKASLRFSAGTTATLEKLRQEGATYKVTVDLLNKGRAWVVTPLSYEMRLTSKAASVVSHPGAVFEVVLDQDENFYDVTKVYVFTGSVQVSGRTESSDTVSVNAGEMARVNNDKLFPAEAFNPTKADDWEQWNLSWAEEAQIPRATADTAPASNPAPESPSPRPSSPGPAGQAMQPNSSGPPPNGPGPNPSQPGNPGPNGGNGPHQPGMRGPGPGQAQRPMPNGPGFNPPNGMNRAPSAPGSYPGGQPTRSYQPSQSQPPQQPPQPPQPPAGQQPLPPPVYAPGGSTPGNGGQAGAPGNPGAAPNGSGSAPNPAGPGPGGAQPPGAAGAAAGGPAPAGGVPASPNPGPGPSGH